MGDPGSVRFPALGQGADPDLLRWGSELGEGVGEIASGEDVASLGSEAQAKDPLPCMGLVLAYGDPDRARVEVTEDLLAECPSDTPAPDSACHDGLQLEATLTRFVRVGLQAGEPDDLSLRIAGDPSPTRGGCLGQRRDTRGGPGGLGSALGEDPGAASGVPGLQCQDPELPAVTGAAHWKVIETASVKLVVVVGLRSRYQAWKFQVSPAWMATLPDGVGV